MRRRRSVGCGSFYGSCSWGRPSGLATATVVGIVVLAQVPSPVEVLGVALVAAGVAVHREPAQPDALHVDEPAAATAA